MKMRKHLHVATEGTDG